MKNATPLQVQDLQPGDRVLVRGQNSTDGHSISALAVIVMKQADVSARHEQEQEDWQKRGAAGLVSAVDPATGNITISSSGLGGKHNIVVHTTKATVARRYAADSIKFDDAHAAPIDQIKPGDQLRARGTKNADGTELTADEIVSGTFRNIAGTITAVDPASNSVTVQDAIRKGPVVVKLSTDSQVKKIPPEFAQRIAMRLKAAQGEGGEQSSSTGSVSGAPSAGTAARSPNAQSSRGPGGAQGGPGNGPPDLQRFLSRLPASKISDLQKGDAVMVVSTEGNNSGAVTAITMLAGVEPILTASSGRNAAAMMLSPWSLGGGAGVDAETAP